MGKAKVLFIAAAALALGGGAWWLLAPAGSAEKVADEETLVSHGQKPKSVDKAKPKSGGRGVKRLRPKAPAPAKKVDQTKKPGFEIGDEEKGLNEVQRKLLEDIRAALRDDDYRGLMKLVHRLQSSDEWPDGIPKSIKMAALKALGWYGGKCLPEMVGFLADLDREVVNTAVSYWDDAIAELEHDVDRNGEAGIATNIKNAAKVVNDVESMESILSEIHSSLRHSVAVETIKDIMANGNDVAKAALAEVIENLTGSEEIKTVEQLEEWLKENPDDPDDEYMYGGKDMGDLDD